jgi:hypothetical protein
MVYSKRTIGSGIILDEQMELLADETQVDAHFGPFGDCGNLDAK